MSANSSDTPDTENTLDISQLDLSSFDWDHPGPFVVPVKVREKDIDVMGHTNNVVYLRWVEKVAWAHSNALGLDWEVYESLNRGMVARRHELDYLAASFAGEDILLATWIVENDKKVTITRAYQFIRAADGQTLLRGKSIWACIDLKAGRARRMPTEFVEGYRITI